MVVLLGSGCESGEDSGAADQAASMRGEAGDQDSSDQPPSPSSGGAPGSPGAEDESADADGVRTAMTIRQSAPVVVDGAERGQRTYPSGFPEKPVATGDGPEASIWELYVWDSDGRKCGGVKTRRREGGGGSAVCGWDLRIDQGSISGGPVGQRPIRAVYGPVMGAVTRIELTYRDGETTSAMLAYADADGVKYYVGFADPERPLKSTSGFNSQGELLVEYKNSREIEDGLRGIPN